MTVLLRRRHGVRHLRGPFIENAAVRLTGNSPLNVGEPILRVMGNPKWAALNSLAINAVLVDDRGLIVDVNTAWEEYAHANGSSIQDWIGINYLSVCDRATGIHFETASAAGGGIRSILKNELREYSLTYACHAPQKNSWYRMRVTQWHDPERTVLITHEDVSELKEAAEALKKSQNQLQSAASKIARRERFVRSITNSFPALLGYWDMNLRCRFANDAYVSWFNRSPTSMIGTSIQEVLGDALFSKNEPFIRGALAGAKQQFERKIVKPDGTTGYMLANYIPDKDRRGKMLGFFVMASEITEFKNSESKLKLAEVSVQSTDEAIVVADASGVILSINPAYTAVTGFDEQESIGQRLCEFDREGQNPTLYDEVQLALQTAGHWQGQIWNRHKNGAAYLEWKRVNRVTLGDGDLTYYVSVFHDTTDLWHQSEKVRRLAFHDALTDLPNRSLMHEHLGQLCTILQRESRNLAVLFIDLDGFKLVNDTLGHNTGDEVLKMVARILAGEVRHNDTVARLGGDEFVVLVDNPLGRAEVEQLVNRILDALLSVDHAAGHSVSITASIGVSMYPEDGNSADQLLESADAAMYAAKMAGKNCYRFASQKADKHCRR